MPREEMLCVTADEIAKLANEITAHVPGRGSNLRPWD